ncbi:MAG: FtsW/RodA/SpoVE family cell cycle protein [Planctomycetota bacterium]
MRAAVVANLRGALHWPVLVPAALLLVFGVVVLSGLEVLVAGKWQGAWHLRQITGIVVGTAAGAVVLLVPYKSLVSRAYLVYAFNLFLLALVLVAGPIRNESRRWLALFGFDFQPSELMKLTLVLTLARFIRFRSSYKTFRGLWAPFGLTLLPMALILKQPDLGTALLCIPILFTMLFVAGARARHLATIVLLGTLAMFPVYHWGLRPYQKSRIDGFLAQLGLVSGGDADQTEADRKALEKSDRKAREKADRKAREKADRKALEKKENYQVTKSKVAIGSGGLGGVGHGRGEEHALYWVPERHTDFIFAGVANEWGFMGSLAVLALFGWLLAAILGVALRQRDPAGRLICIGVFALFGFQAFINIAMTVGLMPVTGLTLPFLSHGRSSVVVSILAVALVCNVAARPAYEFGRGDFD